MLFLNFQILYKLKLIIYYCNAQHNKMYYLHLDTIFVLSFIIKQIIAVIIYYTVIGI